MSQEDTIRSLPILEPGLVRRRRGDFVESAVQILDIRGGPTDPIRVRAVQVDVAGSGAFRLPAGGGFDVTADVAPGIARPLDASGQHWMCSIDAGTLAQVEAVRRIARAHAGVNLRSSLERRNWSRGDLLSRREFAPLDPPHVLWLEGEAWCADEVCCVTPTCTCRDLHVDFTPLGDSTTEPLSARIDLDAWACTESCGHGLVQALVRTWLALPESHQRARDQFDRGHAVGRGLFDPFVTRRGVVHADARCPCGSGRKFKRCCERQSRVPGDLDALQARARQALAGFAEEIGIPMDLADGPAGFPVVPSDACRVAWLHYWRRTDGFTLADRYLADPLRGDPWLRTWIESASGSPPDVFEVDRVSGRTATLYPLADEGAYEVELSTGCQLRVGEVVLAAPVRLMGRTILEGAWRAAGGKEVGLELSLELQSVSDEVDRLLRPERVLQAMFAVVSA